MRISPVADALVPEGLTVPTLKALAADAKNYNVLLLQPQGVVDAKDHGISNGDREQARVQYGQFLAEATVSQPDLAVTPEYSMPWEVLKGELRNTNGGPAEGKLWALGCESIRYSELIALKNEFAANATFIFENLQPDDTRFVDPLAYVFRTTLTQRANESRLVVLVQLKTYPMADPHEFEKNLLQPGEKIYRFGNPGTGISLLTFICSDMLGFTDLQAQEVYDRALILHIQLNPHRQHTSLRGFRERLLRLSGDATEILTLNWARGTTIKVEDQALRATKFAGSAWYLKNDGIDLSDALLAANHRNGFYYTWMESLRTHAMFFNFAPAVFNLTASKVARIGVPGPVGSRRGPILNGAKTWDVAQNTWTNKNILDDGFESVLPESGDASGHLTTAYESCPCACERLLAISSGDACKTELWHGPKVLDSFSLTEAEFIKRVTFCQPSHADEASFRQRRLRKCARLCDALRDTNNLPLALIDIRDGYTLEWASTAIHQNLRPHGSSRGRATVMHLAESSKEDALAAYDRARQRVYASLPEGTGFAATRRIATWYTDVNGAQQLVYRHPRIDERSSETPVDIGRER